MWTMKLSSSVEWVFLDSLSAIYIKLRDASIPGLLHFLNSTETDRFLIQGIFALLKSYRQLWSEESIIIWVSNTHNINGFKKNINSKNHICSLKVHQYWARVDWKVNIFIGVVPSKEFKPMGTTQLRTSISSMFENSPVYDHWQYTKQFYNMLMMPDYIAIAIIHHTYHTSHIFSFHFITHTFISVFAYNHLIKLGWSNLMKILIENSLLHVLSIWWNHWHSHLSSGCVWVTQEFQNCSVIRILLHLGTYEMS